MNTPVLRESRGLVPSFLDALGIGVKMINNSNAIG